MKSSLYDKDVVNKHVKTKQRIKKFIPFPIKTMEYKINVPVI